MFNLSKKHQKLLCWIPLISSLQILCITCKTLISQKSSIKKWVYLILILCGLILAIFLLNQFVLSGQHLVINFIVSWLCTVLANSMMIDLQDISLEDSRDFQAKEKKMNQKKLLLICGIAVGFVIILIVLVIVGRALFRLLPTESKYTDTNGTENFSLEVLGEKDVLINEYTMFKSHYTYDEGETDVDRNLEEYDLDLFSIQTRVFDGVYTVQATKIKKDQLTLNLNSQVVAGNFEIFILVDDEVAHRIEANCEKEVILNGVKDKIVLVKIVGEGADFSFEVKRSY